MTEHRDDVWTLRRARPPRGLAVLAVVLVATSCASEDGKRSQPQGPSGGPDVATVSLPAAGGSPRCMAPSAEVLGRADLAVDGAVTTIEDDRVTLAVSHAFAGGPVERIEVTQASPSRQALILGVRFEAGGRYLVAAADGDVMVCGFSGPYDRRLARLYERAFTSE